MAEDAPTESHATGSQINPALRQRMLNRAATFAEGAHPLQPLNGRRSSLFSDYSDTRQSFRSSTETLLRPTGNDMDRLTSTEEPSYWHSAPLAFAILPAVGGLLFQNGGAVVTDILLLGLASMFLNWCVRAPWDWYHAAQQIQYIEAEDALPNDTINEEDGESAGEQDEDRAYSPEPSPGAALAKKNKRHVHSQPQAQLDARSELARQEILALLVCFIGPLVGAYLLHAIRSQLTRPAEGLVSNYNLTIFIMAAEFRPVSHLIRMKQARMMHLQRIVRPDSKDRMIKADSENLSRRLGDVEARLAEPVPSSDVDTMKVGASVRQSLQPQLDALNRAVRRYEKRQAAQQIQMEARFGELETRLRDALSLAAAAARTGQRPGMIAMLFAWVVGAVTSCFHTSWAAITYPYRFTASTAAEIQSWFVKTERQPRKRIKGQGNGYFSMPAPRMQSRTGR